MLCSLPVELTLSVLSRLPIPSLLSLRLLSRQWHDFFAAHQSVIFHGAALYHGYIQPGTLSLKDALSVNTGRPCAGSTSWKDLCHRLIQLRKNWEGKGRAVARVLIPAKHDVHQIKIDEKAGICITTCISGGLTVTHLFSGTVLWRLPSWYVHDLSRCEYDDGYVIFDTDDFESDRKEVWRLASDFTAGDEFAASAPPGPEQMAVSADAAELYRHYAPLGQFRPWALLRFDEVVSTYRLAYPTLICASIDHTFLYDVRTGSLEQTINTGLREICSLDVNESHAFVCELNVMHVFSLKTGIEVLRIPAESTVRCSQRVEDPSLIDGDWFIAPISVSPEVYESPRPNFLAAKASRDGRDFVVMSEKHRVVFIKDFERICRGETTFEQAGLVLGIQPKATCYYLGFDSDHSRVCVATLEGLYVFTFGPDLSANAVFLRPSNNNALARRHWHSTSCMQLTGRRIYFTWEESRRRQDIPLFEDGEYAQEPPPPATPIFDLNFELSAVHWRMTWQHGRFDSNSVGYIDFSLMPEGFASEI